MFEMKRKRALEGGTKQTQDQIRTNGGKGQDGARRPKARARLLPTAIVMLTMMMLIALANIGMAVNGFVVNNGIGIRIGKMHVLKLKCGRTFCDGKYYTKGFVIELIADNVEVEAGDAIIDETSASVNEEEIFSSEGEKSTDCESVGGRVSVFTDVTVAQPDINGGCH